MNLRKAKERLAPGRNGRGSVPKVLMPMLLARAALILLPPLVLMTLSTGCESESGSGKGGSASSGERGAGLERDGDDPAANLNPYGRPYPASGTGTKARTGKTAGDTIRNYAFRGYPDGSPLGGLRPMKMADYFDPEGRNNINLIHLQGTAVWCTYCRAESTAVAPKIRAWREKGVVYIVSVAEGTSNGVPAEVKDLAGWLKNNDLSTPAWLDSGHHQLGVFYDAAAMPWNATIDATTMEILDSHMGFEGLAAMEQSFDGWTEEIDARQGQ